MRLEPPAPEHERRRSGRHHANRARGTWLSDRASRGRAGVRRLVDDALANAAAGIELPLRRRSADERRARRRQHAATSRSGPSTGALEIGWTWLAPDRVGHRRQRRGEAAHARARVRAARLPPRRVQDRRAATSAPAARSRRCRRSSRASTASTCSSAAASTATRPGTASSTTNGRAVRANLERALAGTRAAERATTRRVPGIRPTELEPRMIERIQVIGRGRVGSAVAARLARAGRRVRDRGRRARPALRARPRDRRGRRRLEPGPWVAHVSGATPLAALEPHTRRFGLHPLQTFTRARGPSSSTAPGPRSPRETDEARERGFGSRARSGSSRSSSPTSDRAALPRRRSDRVELPRHPPPRRGLAARGGRRAAGGARAADAADDRERLRADRADRARRLGHGRARTSQRSAASAPELEPLYACSRRRRGARVKIVRTIAELRATLGPLRTAGRRRSASCRRWARSTTGHLALFRAAARRSATASSSACSSTRRSSARPRISTPIRATRKRDLAIAAEAGVDVVFAPVGGRDVSTGLPDVGRGRRSSVAGLEGAHRPGHFRGVATVCLKLFNDRPPRSRLLRPEGRPAGRRRSADGRATWSSSSRCASLPTVRDADGLALSSRNVRLSPAERDGRARPAARARDAATATTRARDARAGSTSTTSRSPTSTHPSSPPPSASAPPA